ncbi:MAG: hypothetical protein IKW88_07630 [Clostridiales bacterium]|nr:hypothetical protein [Clostridiales bacterium]
MSEFKVSFSQTVPFGDPEYRSIYLDVNGEAGVSCADRSGDENDIKYVQALIVESLNEQLFKQDDGKTSYKDLPAKSNEFGQGVASELETRGIKLLTFSIISIAPDARTQERITQLDKAKAFSAMSPADQIKMMEEANKRAQEELSKLSAEQRQQAEEQAKKMMEAQAADMQKIMEQVNQFKSATASGAAIGAAAGASAFAAPKKKFCTNCGAPLGKGKFCGKCGKPLN